MPSDYAIRCRMTAGMTALEAASALHTTVDVIYGWAERTGFMVPASLIKGAVSKKEPEKKKTSDSYEIMYQLCAKGYTDRQIAAATGFGIKTIFRFRQANGLMTSREKKLEYKTRMKYVFRALWDMGASNRQINEALEVNPLWIEEWTQNVGGRGRIKQILPTEIIMDRANDLCTKYGLVKGLYTKRRKAVI